MNNMTRVIGALMITLLLLIMSIVVNSGAESQIHATDVDFELGIFENTEVLGTGADAHVSLTLTEDGSYATGFDNDGANSTNPSTGTDYARCVAVDTNYIYVAGYSVAADLSYQWRVEKRDKISGELVTAFDTDGVIESNPSGSVDQAHSITVDSSYVYIAGSDSTQGNQQWRIEKRDKYTGTLVTAFDTDGVVESDPSITLDAAYSIAVDSSYIYAAGYDYTQLTNYQWRIEKRDKTTGALVTAFDTDGVIESNPSVMDDQAYSITVDSSYIYIAGDDRTQSNYQWRVEKRDKTTGALVSAFDSDGVVESNPSIGTDIAQSITIDPDYIYVAGYDVSLGGSNPQWRVEKRDKTTGALVTAFDSDGVVESNPSTTVDRAYSIAVDSDYIYVTGEDQTMANYQWRIEKRDKTTGALVNAFDTDGIVQSNPSSSIDQTNSIAIDSNYIYVVGWDRIPGNYEWRIEKRDITTGASASGFDSDGIINTNPSSWNDMIRDMTVESDYIYCVGDDYSNSNFQWRIEKRYKSNGALVTSFDTDGVVESNPTTSSDSAYCIAVDPDYIYVGGYDWGPGNMQWRIEKRDKSTGALVTAFDTDGVVQNNPSSSTEYLYSIAVDSNYIYAAGYDYALGNSQWRIEKRDKSTGALVTAFDTDGVITVNPSSNNEVIRSIMVDDQYIYAAGDDASSSTSKWRVEKRDKTTGSLISGFGPTGVIYSDPTINNDNIYSSAIDSDYIYLAGSDYAPGDFQWRIEKRYKENGSLVTSFGTGGVVTNNTSPGFDTLYQIKLYGDHIYVVGTDDYHGSNARWHLEKRDKNTGELVSAFGNNGVFTSNPTIGRDTVYTVAVDSSHVYMAGYDNSPSNYQWRIEKLNNHVYAEHGLYYSPIIESSGADNVVWSTISWTSDVLPPDTMIKFQLAANDDGTNWDYSGPDGTEDTYYETAGGQQIWSGLSGKFLKYKAYFSSDDTGYTPTLDDVTITQMVVEPPSVKVTSPNGGEDWMKGDYYPITWNAEGSLNSTPVCIYYSTNNGASWTAVDMWVENTGYYNWTVPNVNTGSAMVKIVVYDIYGRDITDSSDASFAIDPPPAGYPGGGGTSDYVPPDEGTMPSDSGKEERTETGTEGELDGWMVALISALAVVAIVSIIINVILVRKKKEGDRKEEQARQRPGVRGRGPGRPNVYDRSHINITKRK